MGNNEGVEPEHLGLRLRERIKELTLLHRASRLLDGGCSPSQAVLDELVSLLPRAWQFPELCEARIRWLNFEARTPQFAETEWMLRASCGAERDAGVVEVAYRHRPPASGSDVFAQEERELISSFAEMLGASFGRARAEQLLREREERLAFLHALSEATNEASRVEDMLEMVVSRLGRHLGVSRCLVARVEPNGVSCTVLHDYTDGCASMVGPYELSALAAEVLPRATRPVVVRDIAGEWTRTPKERDAAAKNEALGVRAMIVSSYVKNGVLRAITAVHQTTPRDWTEREVMLVSETVARTWSNIEQRGAELKLRRNEELLRIAGEAARLGGWSIDLPEPPRISWSDEVCAILDVPPGTVPTLEEAIAFYAPEYRALVLEAVQACITRGTPFDVAAELVSAKGRRVYVRAIGRAERSRTGEIVRLQGALQDVSHRRRLEEHVRRSQKMEAIGHLAASVAHDFNTVLSVILNYSSFVADKLGAEHPLGPDVAEIQIAARSAAKLTGQLLTFGRQQARVPERVDLSEVVRGIEKLLRRLAGPRMTLEVRAGDPIGLVLVDPGQVEQVLMNLVVNARDAMDAQGTISISLADVTLDGAHQEGRASSPDEGARAFVALEVRDSGHGMDAATRARIFEPFFTTKDKGKGTGLGLATVYGIVTQSGGSIHVESQPGVGTTFTVYFPRVDHAV